ncbi:MAG: hypothetical protein ACLGI3_07545, partial [Actinomycetes bacterium]
MPRLVVILAALLAAAAAVAATPAPGAPAGSGPARQHCEDHRPPDDFDCDFVKDADDNCPEVSNQDQ